MKLYSYVVARDYGFAPNPFFGVCTLATCKPIIRRCARVGDWIVGTGSAKYKLGGHIVYAMKVTEILGYDQYWEDKRFFLKRPILTGSLKQAFGDNIYHRNARTKKWVQINSHHSLETGKPNNENIAHDTQTSSVLIGSVFTYWGAHGPSIPKRFCGPASVNICIGRRNHNCSSSEKHISSFLGWIDSLAVKGYVAPPAEFLRNKPRRPK